MDHLQYIQWMLKCVNRTVKELPLWKQLLHNLWF